MKLVDFRRLGLKSYNFKITFIVFCFKISNLKISNQIHATKQKLQFNINEISKQIFDIKEFSSRLSDMKQKALSESKRNEINANTNKIFYFHFLL